MRVKKLLVSAGIITGALAAVAGPVVFASGAVAAPAPNVYVHSASLPMVYVHS